VREPDKHKSYRETGDHEQEALFVDIATDGSGLRPERKRVVPSLASSFCG
jgi:hypothetical protein